MSTRITVTCWFMCRWDCNRDCSQVATCCFLNKNVNLVVGWVMRSAQLYTTGDNLKPHFCTQKVLLKALYQIRSPLCWKFQEPALHFEWSCCTLAWVTTKTVQRTRNDEKNWRIISETFEREGGGVPFENIFWAIFFISAKYNSPLD